MRELLMYAGLGGFLCGVAAASLWPHTMDLWFIGFLGVTLLLVALRRHGKPRAVHILMVGVFCLTLAAGAWRTQYYSDALQERNDWQEGERISETGIVDKEPLEGRSSLQLEVETERGVLLVYTDRHQHVDYGDVITVSGTVKRPESFETDLGREFNYPGYLAARGITHTVSFADVTVLERGKGHPFMAQLLRVKAFMLERLEEFLPEPQAGLAEGLLLGVKRALGAELEENFRRSGIIHIVVLSGYNIMLVVVFVLYVFSYFLPWRLRLLCGLLAILCFALMVGASATVVRASLMAGIALIARSLGRTYAVVRALLVAGLLMLLIDPYLLVFDPGFQLSFLATLGLITVGPRIESLLTLLPQTLGVREFLAATLATQLLVLPLLLYQIGEFSVVSVVVNVLVLPIVPLAMLASFLLIVIGMFSSPLATLVAYVAYAALSYIVLVPTFFASLPFAAFSVPQFPFGLVVLAYAVLAFYFWRGRAVLVDPLEGWTIVTEASLQPEHANTTPVFFR